MFRFCKFLWLLDLRICFHLKRVRPWSEFRINFNQCSMTSFQRTLVGFNNLWIHFIFMQFKCLPLSKVPSDLVKLGVWEVVFFAVPTDTVYIFFIFIFDVFWNSINLVSVPKLRWENLVLVYLLPLKDWKRVRLTYHWAGLSFHFHVVLKSLASY